MYTIPKGLIQLNYIANLFYYPKEKLNIVTRIIWASSVTVDDDAVGRKDLR